jgi:hypothetical protein
MSAVENAAESNDLHRFRIDFRRATPRARGNAAESNNLQRFQNVAHPPSRPAAKPANAGRYRPRNVGAI